MAHRAIQRSTQELPPAQGSAKVRILATTDLHMHLTSHNFVTDTNTENPGLAGIATLIAQARAEAKARKIGCLLFDNGDLLQGTALGDWLAQREVTDTHPAIACLNGLDYDAIGVGNHDLDYGLPYLRDVAARLSPPMVASNLSAAAFSPLTAAALVTCALPAQGATPEAVLTVGILSVLPQQTAVWNHHLLDGIATIQDADKSLRAAIPALRAGGADIVVVLAHMGLDRDCDDRDTALPLAQIPGIDAMITGHTHRRFPGDDHSDTGGLNSADSTVAQVPAVMPGHAGSDLAVLDLTLQQNTAGHWRVSGHESALRRNQADTPPAPAVMVATCDVQSALRDHLSVTVAQTANDLHNYFAIAAPTSTCALTASAKMCIARKGLKDTPEADLPLLAASSAHTAGGRDGPLNFLSIPKGPVLRRHLWGLNPYGNRVWVVRLSGAEVMARLEHAATVFNQLRADAPDQPLRNSAVPPFNYDTIFGLRYSIDAIQPEGHRIRDLTYQGAHVLPEQEFLLATNQFRVAGGGGYAPVSADRVVLRSHIRLEEGLIDVLEDTDQTLCDPCPWSIKPSAPVSAMLETAPEACRHLAEMSHLSPQVGPVTEAGFVQLRLTF